MSVPQPSGVHLGIDIGGTKMLVLANTPAGRRHWTFPTGLNATPATLKSQIASVLHELRIPHPDCIGVAVPGLVDAGLVAECDVLPQIAGWRPTLDWPHAVVLNDGEAALVRVASTEDPAATVVAIGCGTGIATASQIAGHRLRQSRPYSGELGFAPCGFTGTFDEFASGAAILRQLSLSPEVILERLQHNDPACRQVIQKAGEAFGLGIVTVIHLLHPSAIGLYGGTLRYPGYLDAAIAAVDRWTHPLLRPDCRVHQIPDPGTAVALGALLAAQSAQ